MSLRVTSPLGGAVKRAVDVVFGGLGLVLIAPLMLGVAAAVRAHDGGPVFYRQVRVGRGGRPFHLWKFRTMSVDADRTGPGVTVGGDRRVTPVGAKLRRWKLDELPQLWNVLKGDMTLVGPRPELPSYVELYDEEQRAVLAVRPGLTDPATLTYRDEEALLAAQPDPLTYYRNVLMAEKLRLSLAYLERATVWTDFGVMADTAGMLLGRSSIAAGGVDYRVEEERIRRVYAGREGKRALYAADRPENPFWAERRERVARRMLAETSLPSFPRLRCLDVGCGAGGWLETLAGWGVAPEHASGLDLLPERIEEARTRLPGADLRVASGFDLPYEDESFDLVCANTVFSSILDPAARGRLAEEILRVTQPDGVVLVYDFRISHPRNPDTVGIGRAEVARLFRTVDVRTRSLTLAPPLARPLARVSVAFAGALESMAPFFRTHSMHLIVVGRP